MRGGTVQCSLSTPEVLQSVAPAERKPDHTFGCKVCLNPTLHVASFKLKVF